MDRGDERSELTNGEPRVLETEPDRQTQPVDGEAPPRLSFPVVGIGASAGGLEAFSDFLSQLRDDTGMAYVFIQHLPPTGESMLPDILSKRTSLPVQAVEDGMAVEPNNIYVTRPGRTLKIVDGRFQLGELLARPMHSRPVDDFFKSLAEEQRERGIAVILAGMGSNGTAGAQAIKAVGGLCVAQDPETTEFPSMPRHLIDAGYADYILRPQDIPGVLVEYAGHPYINGQIESKAGLAKRDQQHVREVLAVLRTRTRTDFSGYKKPTVLRRIQRRMGLNRITKVGEYAKLLRQIPSEVTALADDLLIHVTGFFRDAPAWEVLRQQVIVPLVGSRESGGSIRCWVTACSSGEEAYTLAMLLVEEAERIGKPLDIKVFATDMAERSLQSARGGIYPGGIEAEITPQRLEQFFQREDAVYRVRQELRERVIFAPQNILQDPPFSRLDIISCRNLLIYLEPDVQQRIIGLLHFGLREGGTLFLGTSETTTGTEGLFEPIDKKARIYRRVGPTRHGLVEFPVPNLLAGTTGTDRANLDSRNPAPPRPSMNQMTTRALLEHHTPAAVTIDRDHRIVYYHGNTEPFISSPRGEPTRDLLQLVRENVRGAVRAAVNQAGKAENAATAPDGWVEIEPGRRVKIAITASPLDSKFAPDYLVVSFHERGDEPADPNVSPAALHSRDTADELRRIREELQSTIEELQTSNEELKASHEEVVSTNEELQSSNEELETSREEMQSLNEELSTVNSQLHAKIEEHQAAHNDLASLLTSTNIAVLFLDTKLRIRRFTPEVRELFEMLPTDVGRPLTDLAKKFVDPELNQDAERVLFSLVPVEREVSGDQDRWYLRRLTPYRTADNRIDGVVASFVDITARVNAEAGLRTSEEKLRLQNDRTQEILDSITDAFYALDANFNFTYVNRQTEQLRGRRREDLIGKNYWAEFPQLVGTESYQKKMAVMRDRKAVQFETLSPIDGWIDVSVYPEAGGGLSCHIRQISQRKTAEEALRASEERFRLLVEGASDFAMMMLNPTGVVTAWNDGAERLLGWDEAEAIGMDAAVIFTPEDRVAGAPEREIGRAAATGRAVDERWHVKKDQTRFWGSGVLSVLRDDQGSTRGFVKVLRDETSRKVAEEALQASKNSAEEANRIKDDFLATLSHELRTPLGAILLWSKLLQGGTITETAQLREGLNAIRTSAEAQKELIEDLLDMSRITTGNLRLQVRDVELLPLLRNALDAIEPTASAKDLTVNADLAADVGVVRVDPDRVRQIVWNLLTNAVKFTPAGGRLDVQLSRRSDEIEVRVSDTGQGIQPEFLPHVFERFRQADASHGRSVGGIGLGLAIVKQLVELHGGSITASSPGPGQGATFTVRLPQPKVARRSGGRKSKAPAAAGNGDSRIDLTGRTVLLVEDDAETRSAVAALMRQHGLRVSETSAAAAAVEAFVTSRPDLLVSDIGLAGEDGYSLIRRIRRHEVATSQSPVPAVALTAFARETDRRMAIEAGFQQHIGKPVEPEELLSVIRELITRR